MKKTSINTILISTILLLMLGCNRLHYPNRQNLVKLDNTSALNGYFRNLSTDTTMIPMWRVLLMTDRYIKPMVKYDKPNIYVQLIGKNNRTIVAKLFMDSTLITEKTFKGKIRGNYFVTRRKVRYRGVPFIIGMEADCKLQFSKDSSNNIIIDDTFSTMGWVFILASGTNGQDNYKYIPK